MPIFDDPRSAWNAAPATNPITVPINERTEFFNHYYGGAMNYGAAQVDHFTCLQMVKNIQHDHMTDPAKEWSDIGYNGLVCNHGRAIEGRGIDIQGAQAAGHNRSGWGFMFFVGGDEVPSVAAFNRMAALYDTLNGMVDDNYNSTGTGVPSLAKKIHSDAQPTSCPGIPVTEWVRGGMLPFPVIPPPIPPRKKPKKK
jgi:hypothetical protein